jgi:hypothetical protein
MRSMTRRLLELLAAGAVLTLFVAPAVSQETTGRAPASEPEEQWDAASGALRAPPFTGLPWMSTDAGNPATADGLVGAQLQTLGPFLLEPAIPPQRFSSTWWPAPRRSTE